MFDLFKKSAPKQCPCDDEFDEEDIVTWERYNTETGEVEDTLEVECHDEDGLEAMEALTDVKRPNGEWQGYQYVYVSNGVEKHIRPINYK